MRQRSHVYTIAISVVVILYFLTIIGLNACRYRAGNGGSQEKSQKKVTSMGLGYYVHLFNLRVYRERVLPAYQALIDRGDTEALITLTRECMPILDANPRLSKQLLWDKESCEEGIGILNGTIYYNSKGNYGSSSGKGEATREDKQIYFEEQLGPSILQVLCVPRYEGVDSEQDMARTPLIPYLYERSEWIKDLFTNAIEVQGGALEIIMGEWSELFTKQDLQEFSAQLGRVPAPKDPILRKEYENLGTLVKLALEDEELTLVLSLK
jgi:hypothetical protein